MDAQRRGSEMTDGALDGELRSILAANPSPEFVARVRVRIADEPRPASTWRYTTFAIAGVVAAVVVAAVLFGRDSGQRTPAPMSLVARAIGGVSALPERPRRSVARSTRSPRSCASSSCWRTWRDTTSATSRACWRCRKAR